MRHLLTFYIVGDLSPLWQTSPLVSQLACCFSFNAVTSLFAHILNCNQMTLSLISEPRSLTMAS